jgi:hypothetical protein
MDTKVSALVELHKPVERVVAGFGKQGWRPVDAKMKINRARIWSRAGDGTGGHA